MQSVERVERVKQKLRREFGPIILAALQDPDVIEIVLNPDGCLWLDRLGDRGMSNVGTMSPVAAMAAIATIATTLDTALTSMDAPLIASDLMSRGKVRFGARLGAGC